MNTPIFGENLIFIIVIILASTRIHVYGASIGDTCTSDANCTSSLVNSKCSRMFDCETGTCACQSGYGNSNGDGCNKILRGYNEVCGSAYYCNVANQECDADTGRCACTYWYDYNSLSGECTLRSYSILTESCGGWYNIPCLPTLLNEGGQCSGICTCQSGYKADIFESFTTCRAPRWGESCQWSPQCVSSFDTSTISDDDSSTAPTCTENVCTCPPSHEHRVVNGYDLCLNSVDSGFVRYSNGENCTDFNECASFLCVKCPGAASGVCMEDSGAVSKLYQSSVPWMTGIVLASVLVTL